MGSAIAGSGIVISLGASSEHQSTPTYDTNEISNVTQSGKSTKIDCEQNNLSKSYDLNESFGTSNNHYCYCVNSKICHYCEERDNAQKPIKAPSNIFDHLKIKPNR